ncbi:hypothetical protein PGT21_033873 [Puccinia graminis f. sp. tritici]|uniref:PWWP domain-containing protein n=1 Tax=Puccinia graminis f. sp. tritici TaxID=56615 RepID=A0A5B0MMN2_PUCGR|nr:hypothetical protein PGT21_033873 [Puccinia graminis f. sp. tritici]
MSSATPSYFSFNCTDVLTETAPTSLNTDQTPSYMRSLPNVSELLDPALNFWGEEESRTHILHSAPISNYQSHSTVQNESWDSSPSLETFRGEEQFVLPGEPILCKTKRNSTEYWPARLISYEGFSNMCSTNPIPEKLYWVHFCDEERVLLPRTCFLTAFDEGFRTVNVGQLTTSEGTFDEILPKLLKELPKLDSIIAGGYADQSVRDQHKNHLSGITEAHGRLNTNFGRHSEAIVTSIGDYLRDRPSLLIPWIRDFYNSLMKRKPLTFMM